MRGFYYLPGFAPEKSPPIVECANPHCGNQFSIKKVFLWTWRQNDSWYMAGFCGFKCSLKAMNKKAMCQA